jgi:hypothetical protein
VAQTISIAAANILKTPEDLPPIVYIDNIFFLCVTEKRQHPKRFIPPFLPEVGDHEMNHCVPVLGRMVDTRLKRISLSPHFLEKINALRNKMKYIKECTNREYLQAWGAIFFAIDVTHISLAESFNAINAMSRICAEFIAGNIELDETMRTCRTNISLLSEVLEKYEWDATVHLPDHSQISSFPITCFTDASQNFGGVVAVGGPSVLISSFQFPPEINDKHINVKEAFAAWHGLSLCI